MVRFIVLVAVAAFALFNHQLAYGMPWRPRRFHVEPETPRDQLERWMALALTALTIVASSLILLAVEAAG